MLTVKRGKTAWKKRGKVQLRMKSKEEAKASKQATEGHPLPLFRPRRGMYIRSSLGPLAHLSRRSLGRPNMCSALLSSCKCTGSESCPPTASLLSAEKALELFHCGGAKFVDGSWQLGKGSLTNEFAAERIPGAQFFDVDEISDRSSSLPHMLPSESDFAEVISSMGISSSDHVIVYTQPNTFSWARVWWTFRVFGHEKVSVLNGGLGAWKAASGRVESGPRTAPPPRGQFTAKLNSAMVADWREVLRVVETGSAQIIDARSLARFLAQAPEPRPGLPGGHIPGSLSLPHGSITKETDCSELRSPAEIRDAFVNAGFVMGSNAVLTCGSGVTAAVLLFGLHLLGKDMSTLKLYDGSWTEWASRPDLPRIPEKSS